MMSGQQRTSCPPSGQLPAFALGSRHHPGGPATPELPHAHTTALTQTHHAASANISFTQPAEDRDGCECFYTEMHRYMIVFRQASSHRPDQALGGYRWVARTDFPLRGLTAIKESRAVFLLSSSSSSSSSRLSNWCCSRTNNTPCAPAYRENNTRLKSPDCICWLMFILYDYMSTDLHRRNILWYKLCGINPLRGGFSAAAVQSSNSCLIQKYIKL